MNSAPISESAGGLNAPNKYPDSTANSNRCGLSSSVAASTVARSTPPNVCAQLRTSAQLVKAYSVFIRCAYDKEGWIGLQLAAPHVGPLYQRPFSNDMASSDHWRAYNPSP